jgi:hypothetical protein
VGKWVVGLGGNLEHQIVRFAVTATPAQETFNSASTRGELECTLLNLPDTSIPDSTEDASV